MLSRLIAIVISVLSSTNHHITTAAKIYDVEDQGTSFNPGKDERGIYVLDPLFYSMLPDRCDDTIEVKLRHKATEPLFHEGPVLFDDALYFVSNRLGKDSNKTISWGETNTPKLDQFIKILKLDLESNAISVLKTDPCIQMANEITYAAEGENILVLSQGYNTTGGAIFELNRKALEAKPVLTTFFGREFNSPNDIETTSDGIIFFSDPPYGFEQGKK